MTDQPTIETELAELRNRLRLAHQARRAKEHQLDDIRRALCDAGLMQDDDPYSHADLADVIRQAAPAEAAEPDTVTDPAWLCQQYAKAIAADDGHPWDTLPADRQENYLDNADAVLRVRDQHLDQLRQRLEAADALYDDAREQLRLVDGMRQQNLDSAAAAIQRAEHAEAALARVRSLADRWDNALGIDKTYARTLRAALDEHGPAAGGCSAPGPRTEPNNTGRAAAEATEPVRCPCDGTHFPSPENCRWCKCHRAWTPPPPGDRREATLRAAVHHDGNHLYLSTGCLHHDHAYCNNMTGLNGAKRPGECKHCGARCICACHTAPGP